MSQKRKKVDDYNKVITINNKILKREWSYCNECNTKVKSKNLARHVKQKHHKILRIETTSVTKNSKAIAAVIVIIILIATVGGYILYISYEKGDTVESPNSPYNDGSMESGELPENGNSSKNNNSHENETNWWENYTAKYLKGSGDDNWWINYPDQHPDSGSKVNHPEWVIDSLENKSVVILVHSDRCDPCIQQQKDMEEVLEEYGEEVEYYDIMSDGSDDRANDSFESYDPNNEQNYIPLTVMVSLIKDEDGDIKILWHSAEGATGKEWISDYMKDGIYYYYQNSEEWKEG